MKRPTAQCPGCGELLAISWDMWGSYYLCRSCGYAAEDDDDLTNASPEDSTMVPAEIARTKEPASRR